MLHETKEMWGMEWGSGTAWGRPKELWGGGEEVELLEADRRRDFVVGRPIETRNLRGTKKTEAIWPITTICGNNVRAPRWVHLPAFHSNVASFLQDGGRCSSETSWTSSSVHDVTTQKILLFRIWAGLCWTMSRYKLYLSKHWLCAHVHTQNIALKNAVFWGVIPFRRDVLPPSSGWNESANWEERQQ
jgi:hypothetical protein